MKLPAPAMISEVGYQTDLSRGQVDPDSTTGQR